MNYQLVIFDMDGTLVQSEDCASQALIDVIPALNDSVEFVTQRYRGMRLAEIFDDIERATPGSIPEGCLELYRAREDVLASTMIEACPGADAMLSTLSTNKCIASNAPVKKTLRSLALCGLSDHFPSGVYSAYQVNAWKPDPTLFLYAASESNMNPADCLVVEDSLVGLEAAQAAGMFPVFYDPHESTVTPDGVTRITALMELLDLVE
ncbi:MAG: HAD-IA family hydrolase [Granulosicoccus sp.]